MSWNRRHHQCSARFEVPPPHEQCCETPLVFKGSKLIKATDPQISASRRNEHFGMMSDTLMTSPRNPILFVS